MKNIYGIVFLIISISSYAQNALNFDGINDYVQAANAGPAGSSSRTVELWVNPSYIPSTQTVFVDWGAMALGNRFTLNMINGTPRIEIGGSGLNATTSITVGNWYHIAATFDNGASTKYKIYVNGNLSNSGNLSTTINTSTLNGIIIGRRNDSIKYFTGSIDEVRIWNVALSQNEIAASMNNEYCTLPSNLVAYYKFNQGIASGNNSGITTLFDASSNSNNGTLNNFTLSGNTSNWISGKPQLVNTFDTIYPVACFSYTSPSGLYTYTSSGIYNDTLITSFGCDSIISINLTIDTIDTSVSQTGGTLTANETGASYQWLDCDNNYAVLAGDTNQSFTPLVNGNYALEITKNGCVDTSLCYSVNSVGISFLKPYHQITVYPNPGKGTYIISSKDGLQNVSIEIFDIHGKMIEAGFEINGIECIINLSKQSNGIYYLKIRDRSGMSIHKLLKN